MKLLLKILFIFLLLSISLLSQAREQNQFNYLEQIYFENNNQQYDQFLLLNLKQFLINYPQSQHCGPIFLMMANLNQQRSEEAEALLNYTKIVFLCKDKVVREQAKSLADSLLNKTSYSQILVKTDQIQPGLTGTHVIPEFDTAYSNYLSFVYSLNIKPFAKLLLEDIQYFKTVVATDDNNLENVLFWQAKLNQECGKFWAANAYYRQVLMEYPNTPQEDEILFQLGIISYYQLKKHGTARDSFIELINQHPKSPFSEKAQYYLAELFQDSLKMNQEALNHYQLYLEFGKDSTLLRQALQRCANIFEVQGDTVSALRYYQNYFEKFPADSTSPSILSKIILSLKNREVAIEKLAQTMLLFSQHYPHHPDADKYLFKAGQIYIDKLGDRTRAKSALNILIKMYPKSDYSQKARELINNIK